MRYVPQRDRLFGLCGRERCERRRLRPSGFCQEERGLADMAATHRETSRAQDRNQLQKCPRFTRVCRGAIGLEVPGEHPGQYFSARPAQGRQTHRLQEIEGAEAMKTKSSPSARSRLPINIAIIVVGFALMTSSQALARWGGGGGG